MPNCWKYDYDDKWIIENYPGKCTQEFYSAYCKHTGFIGNKEVLRKHCRSLEMDRSPWRAYTPEMDAWLAENYPKLGRVAASKLFIETFNVDYSWRSVAFYAAHDLGLHVDKEVAYHNRHRFYDYQTDHLYADGELRDDCGYTVIKIDGKWVSYRRYLWEQIHGKVPKGYSITYLEDPYDFSMDNTVCVPTKYITMLTARGLRAENKVITKCGIKWCELYYAMKQAEGAYVDDDD